MIINHYYAPKNCYNAIIKLERPCVERQICSPLVPAPIVWKRQKAERTCGLFPEGDICTWARL